MTAIMRDAVSPDLRATLRALKLGQMLDTLPDRLTLARQQKMAHADFLELVLADEVTRREAKSAGLRARAAGLDPGMRLDTWDASAAVRYDHQLWNELTSLRFLDGPHGALILGPVGTGKTHLACALGHIAIRRRRTVHEPYGVDIHDALGVERRCIEIVWEIRRERFHRVPVCRVSVRRIGGSLRRTRISMRERIDIAALLGGGPARKRRRLGERTGGRVTVGRAHRFVDVRAHRKRDAPPGHRELRIELRRIFEAFARLAAIE